MAENKNCSESVLICPCMARIIILNTYDLFLKLKAMILKFIWKNKYTSILPVNKINKGILEKKSEEKVPLSDIKLPMNE